MAIDQLLLFVFAGWLLNLTPGPDVLYIVSHALRSGVRAGIVAGLGITAGCFVHIFAAALGVGALLAASSTAFGLLKWTGAAYLMYVGFKLLFSRSTGAFLPIVPWPASSAATSRLANHQANPPHADPPQANPPHADPPIAPQANPPAVSAPDLWPIFAGGFWTNVLNPKVAIFFLAFVPQFIPQDSQHPTWAFLALGLIFNVNAIPVNAAWAWAAAWMARRAARVQVGLHWMDRVAGVMFIGFGLKLGLTDNLAS